MRRVQRVSEQDHIPVAPLPVADQREAEPFYEVVRQEALPVKVVGEHALQVCAHLWFRHRSEPGTLPRLGLTLDDKRAVRPANL